MPRYRLFGETAKFAALLNATGEGRQIFFVSGFMSIKFVKYALYDIYDHNMIQQIFSDEDSHQS